jgi:two-component system sensor histidine kinase UhpB
VLVTNTVVLCLVPVLTGSLAAPGGHRFAAVPALIAAVPLLLLWLVNFYLLRGAFAPLRKLSEFADRVDLLHPGRRLELRSRSAEVVVVTEAINRMLARLEDEQRSTSRRAVAAQEDERKRIAQELHDEVGQTLTAVLLELDQVARRSPPELREQLMRTLEAARGSLEDVRRIAVELRPEALDELGLPGALITLCDRFDQGVNVRVDREVQRDLPALSEEQELVFYRVAQEALTNAARHSGSPSARVSLRHDEHGLRLEVADQGRGLSGAMPGTGVSGMRERANLIHASLSISEAAEGGTIVRLILPRSEEPRGD